MEFFIKNVDFKADEWEVTAAIAKLLHLCPGHFVTGPKDRLPNFRVTLNKSPAGGIRNDGSGTFTMTKSEGNSFQRLNKEDQISIQVRGKGLRFIPNGNAVETSLILELEKSPFVDPDIAKDRARRINTLCDPFHLTRVQIGLCSLIGAVSLMMIPLFVTRYLLSPKGCTPSGTSLIFHRMGARLSRKEHGVAFF